MLRITTKITQRSTVFKTFLCSVVFAFALGSCSKLKPKPAEQEESPSDEAPAALDQAAPDPAEVALGERLFREPRFAQRFFDQVKEDQSVNTPITNPDPNLKFSKWLDKSLMPGPYAGKTVSCSSCHFVDEHLNTPGAGMRAYTDFARRTPVPERPGSDEKGDDRTDTVRNTPTMVGATVNRSIPIFLHSDGEFTSIIQLARFSLSGRNFGWLPTETSKAEKHFARVIREDDGSGELAANYGKYSYATVLRGDPSVDPAFQLPVEYQIDVASASDEQIVHAISRLIAAYSESLTFSNQNGVFNGSPFDLFMKRNSDNLPIAAFSGESPQEYSVRLREALDKLQNPRFVSPTDPATPRFQFHRQAFKFGESELAGLKLFLGSANCASCHTPPNFTDFKFHNTGIGELEYNAVHSDHGRLKNGPKFQDLKIPTLEERNRNPKSFLPRSANYPSAVGSFFRAPVKDKPEYADLGLWNVFLNDTTKSPTESQATLAIKKLILQDCPDCKTDDEFLEKTIAAFKTPSLRDLGHTNPYFHDGSADTLEDVLRTYIKASTATLRNESAELKKVKVESKDIPPLVDFLKSLNEDYQ